ncbi:MAG: hypothetical protein ACOH15_04215 [Acetobacterium sp.]
MENKKKSKKNWVLPVIILALLLCSIFLVGINKIQTDERLAAIGEDEVKITANGKEISRLKLQTVKDLPKVIIAEGLNTSNGKEDLVFGGVLLKDVFKSMNFDYTQYNQVTYKAIDGYVSTGMAKELDGETVYLVYERNSVQNTGKSQGGTGLMEIIITGEQFSLRNCKFLNEINFE